MDTFRKLNFAPADGMDEPLADTKEILSVLSGAMANWL
jgi:hypothetical protein